MAERKFEYENVRTIYDQMKTIVGVDGQADSISDILNKINKVMHEKMDVCDEALYGDLAKQLMLDWDNVSSDFPSFISKFDNWCNLISASAGDYSQFEQDVAGFRELNPLGNASGGIQRNYVESSAYATIDQDYIETLKNEYVTDFTDTKGEKYGCKYIDTEFVSFEKQKLQDRKDYWRDIWVTEAISAVVSFGMPFVIKGVGAVVSKIKGSISMNSLKGSLTTAPLKGISGAADDIANVSDDVLNASDDVLKNSDDLLRAENNLKNAQQATKEAYKKLGAREITLDEFNAINQNLRKAEAEYINLGGKLGGAADNLDELAKAEQRLKDAQQATKEAYKKLGAREITIDEFNEINQNLRKAETEYINLGGKLGNATENLDELANAQQRLKDAQQAAQDAYKKYAKGDITKAEFDEISRQLHDVEEEVFNLNAKTNPNTSVDDLLKSVEKAKEVEKQALKDSVLKKQAAEAAKTTNERATQALNDEIAKETAATTTRKTAEKNVEAAKELSERMTKEANEYKKTVDAAKAASEQANKNLQDALDLERAAKAERQVAEKALQDIETETRNRLTKIDVNINNKQYSSLDEIWNDIKNGTIKDFKSVRSAISKSGLATDGEIGHNFLSDTTNYFRGNNVGNAKFKPTWKAAVKTEVEAATREATKNVTEATAKEASATAAKTSAEAAAKNARATLRTATEELVGKNATAQKTKEAFEAATKELNKAVTKEAEQKAAREAAEKLVKETAAKQAAAEAESFTAEQAAEEASIKLAGKEAALKNAQQAASTGGSNAGNVTGAAPDPTPNTGGSNAGNVTGAAPDPTPNAGGSNAGNATGSDTVDADILDDIDDSISGFEAEGTRVEKGKFGQTVDNIKNGTKNTINNIKNGVGEKVKPAKDALKKGAEKVKPATDKIKQTGEKIYDWTMYNRNFKKRFGYVDIKGNCDYSEVKAFANMEDRIKFVKEQLVDIPNNVKTRNLGRDLYNHCGFIRKYKNFRDFWKEVKGV